ncbi:MAG TPA: Ldh family oxidoreductase [Chloroflexota bacterium]|nr:Ldh family oxidoreductase [Chloroflexota bacterium]
MAEDYARVDEGALCDYTAAILRAAGMGEEGARIAATVLVASDARGIESHGVARLPQYIKLIEAGVLDPAATPVVERQSASTALVDARNGMGHVAGDYAMRLAIEKARAHDVGVALVRNSNHYGIAGYYAMLALEHDLIGISLTNSSPLVAPTRGRTRMIGTNPIAVAIPTGGDLPFVLDMATSTVPVGRLEVYARKGLPLQPGWAVDADGRETLDAEAGRQGALLPLGGTEQTGGYKGYGLGVMVDMLTGVLSGALYGNSIGGLWDATVPSDLGHFFMALNPAAFGPLDRFKDHARDLLRRLKESALAPEETEILVAGEKEQRAHQDALEHGVRLYHTVVTAMNDLGARAGLDRLPVRPDLS